MSKCSHPECKNIVTELCRCPCLQFCKSCQEIGNSTKHKQRILHNDSFETTFKIIGKCTFPKTRKSYWNQWFIQCKTCNDKPHQGGCLYCRKECYNENHDCIIHYTSFFCDVGAAKLIITKLHILFFAITYCISISV